MSSQDLAIVGGGLAAVRTAKAARDLGVVASNSPRPFLTSRMKLRQQMSEPMMGITA